MTAVEPHPVDASHSEPGVIDTSKMSEGKRAAMELAEASRESFSANNFAGSIFMGKFPWEVIHPYPAPRSEEQERANAFLKELTTFLEQHVDGDEIDRTGEIPDATIDGFRKLGAFGIKIPQEYEGLGHNQYTYSRAMIAVGSVCGSTTALLSAHQSIGVPNPLKLFGSDEQKEQWLPKLARGAISAFALTESQVGSDPAKMETIAELDEAGEVYTINGNKLWCTNGTNADVIIVMAQTRSKASEGKKGKNISAFIVPMDAPGVEVTHRCRFMGLRALYNAVIVFKDVKIPAKNLIGAEGRGLKIALTTLNTGRLSIPAACTGASKRLLKDARRWAAERVQWGHPVIEHAAIAERLASMAANTFAMEAQSLLGAALTDRGSTDIRVEAAMAKMWVTERSWDLVNDAMQIRGGRGYETADSLRERGEAPTAIERFMRDSRINTIFEGSSEIMRLFISREALDPHLKIAGDVFNSRAPFVKRALCAIKAGLFYSFWLPRQYLPSGYRNTSALDARLRKHVGYAKRTARRLARRMFLAMVKYGPKLDREQPMLSRFVDIGSEIFAIAATCAYAQYQIGKTPERANELLDLVDLFARQSRLRISARFTSMKRNTDRDGYRLAQRVGKGEFAFLEDGIADSPVDDAQMVI